MTGSVAGVTPPSIYVACVKCNKKIDNEDNSDIITCSNILLEYAVDERVLSCSVLCSTIFPHQTKKGKALPYTFKSIYLFIYYRFTPLHKKQLNNEMK